MALKCGHLAVPLQSMRTVLAWQAVQKVLRCAESLFSEGIFRTSLGKRKRLVGCIWQNMHIALEPPKVNICCKITLHDYFVYYFISLHTQMLSLLICFLQQMYSLHPLLKNEIFLMTSCLSTPCSGQPMPVPPLPHSEELLPQVWLKSALF